MGGRQPGPLRSESHQYSTTMRTPRPAAGGGTATGSAPPLIFAAAGWPRSHFRVPGSRAGVLPATPVAPHSAAQAHSRHHASALPAGSEGQCGAMSPAGPRLASRSGPGRVWAPSVLAASRPWGRPLGATQRPAPLASAHSCCAPRSPGPEGLTPPCVGSRLPPRPPRAEPGRRPAGSRGKADPRTSRAEDGARRPPAWAGGTRDGCPINLLPWALTPQSRPCSFQPGSPHFPTPTVGPWAISPTNKSSLFRLERSPCPPRRPFCCSLNPACAKRCLPSSEKVFGVF